MRRRRTAALTFVVVLSSWSCVGNTGPAAPSFGWALTAVGAPTAWPVSRGEGVIVAIIDSGVDDRKLVGLRSRDLGHYTTDGSMDQRSNPDPVGHGTAVASIVAEAGDLGVEGVSPAARFISIAVTSSGVGSNAAALGPAVRLAVKLGARVINLSLGSFMSDPDALAAIGSAVEAGVIVVAAAGDTDSPTSLFPASLPSVIAVQALDRTGRLGPHANPVASNGIGAPGSAVPSIIIDPLVGTPHAGLDTGSSMATAIVSGAVALLVSCLKAKGLSATQGSLLSALVESALGHRFFQLRRAMSLLGC